MGNYIIIKNKKGLIPKLREIYNKYLQTNRSYFIDAFGNINSFEDCFEITDINQREIRFKTGVTRPNRDYNGTITHNFYGEDFVYEINDLIKKDKVELWK